MRVKGVLGSVLLLVVLAGCSVDPISGVQGGVPADPTTSSAPVPTDPTTSVVPPPSWSDVLTEQDVEEITELFARRSGLVPGVDFAFKVDSGYRDDFYNEIETSRISPWQATCVDIQMFVDGEEAGGGIVCFYRSGSQGRWEYAFAPDWPLCSEPVSEGYNPEIIEAFVDFECYSSEDLTSTGVPDSTVGEEFGI